MWGNRATDEREDQAQLKVQSITKLTRMQVAPKD